MGHADYMYIQLRGQERWPSMGYVLKPSARPPPPPTPPSSPPSPPHTQATLSHTPLPPNMSHS